MRTAIVSLCKQSQPVNAIGCRHASAFRNNARRIRLSTQTIGGAEFQHSHTSERSPSVRSRTNAMASSSNTVGNMANPMGTAFGNLGGNATVGPRPNGDPDQPFVAVDQERAPTASSSRSTTCNGRRRLLRSTTRLTALATISTALFEPATIPSCAIFHKACTTTAFSPWGTDDLTGQVTQDATIDSQYVSIDPFVFSTTAVPEPSSLVLLGVASISCLLAGMRGGFSRSK